ncbi:hypothetical protein PF005_g28887 [Phytophthora fragariae]|uniref:Uncharacterized protein n=1 Tax=Phytophthora fragariae TaxID=53985 RepID=A0A6A3VTK0_9STRA|nr:hypothetical protein PF005_g28887 [Phytophthora fragariae]KAE9175669.1 hypothetical protein PF004_g26313 [Phytophthora fragariae]
MQAAAVVSCLLPLLAAAQDDKVSYSVSLSTGTLIAIVAGCVVVLLLLICCCCCMRKRRKAKRQRELQAAVAAAMVNTPKGDSHAIDVPYEQERQHNTGSTYTGSTTHPNRNGTVASMYGGDHYSSTGPSHRSGSRHPSSLWDDPVVVAARIPVDRVELGELISRGGFGERKRAAVATRAEPSRAAEGFTAAPSLEPLEVPSAALDALAAESAVDEEEGASVAGVWVSIARLPELESPTVTSSSELAEDVVLAEAAVTSAALPSEAEDALVATLSDPAEEADVDVAAADVDEALVLAEAAVDELEVELLQWAVTGVMRSEYSAKVPTVHSSGNMVVRSDSTVWHAVSLHMMVISASVGVLREDGEYPESLAHEVTSSDVSSAVTEAVSQVAAFATVAAMAAAISEDAKTFMLGEGGCGYLCRLENDSRPRYGTRRLSSGQARALPPAQSGPSP